jgi:hypothetical protein
MKIEISKLITVTNFANLKKLSRQHVYRLAENNELTLIKIDNIAFILLDSKADEFERKRKSKV